jgi:hypothetical protein
MFSIWRDTKEKLAVFCTCVLSILKIFDDKSGMAAEALQPHTMEMLEIRDLEFSYCLGFCFRLDKYSLK